ncbi:MAG TPA: ParB/RepB/Spo0J family partition protein [Firmicutes bacterium]|nr:ParB/RepB/Spo0J family partition protein [Bacillota bacterium]
MKLTDVLLSRRRREGKEEKSAENWTEEIQALPIHLIRAGKFQPRRDFADDTLAELAESIEIHGVLHPIVVRRGEVGYEVIVGERRLRACRKLGWEVIPAIVRDIEDKEAAELALIENLQREDLHVFEVAAGYSRLLEEFNLTQEELAGRLGISQANIANKIRLLKLPAEVQKIISREMLSERHARCLLRLSSEAEQLKVLAAVVENGLTVKQTEELVKTKLSEKRQKPPQQKKEASTRKLVFKDIRLLTNSIRQLTDTLEPSGLDVEIIEEEDAEAFRIVVIVKKPQRGEIDG